MKTTVTQLISPTRNTAYTMCEILEKGFVRSNCTFTDIKVKELLHNTHYGDKDFEIMICNLHCSSPVWTNSVSFNIPEVLVKMHRKNGQDSYAIEMFTWKTHYEDEKTESQYLLNDKRLERYERDGVLLTSDIEIWIEDYDNREFVEELDEEDIKILKKLIKEALFQRLMLQKIDISSF